MPVAVRAAGRVGGPEVRMGLIALVGALYIGCAVALAVVS